MNNLYIPLIEQALQQQLSRGEILQNLAVYVDASTNPVTVTVLPVTPEVQEDYRHQEEYFLGVMINQQDKVVMTSVSVTPTGKVITSTVCN